ncbi:MAG: SufS family cysteine desulfurase [Clostridia bacterium]|nr:SufS family cysteine desulfurase [Clostridia bacterium]
MTKKAEDIRKDFPLIFGNDKIVYLDSGATSQKPRCVLDAVETFYERYNANIHRGAYGISVEATAMYDEARAKVASFIHASRPEEVVFCKNATEAANLLAYCYGLENVGEGDEIVISIMEHHSNLVPWQMVARQKKAKLVYMYIDGTYTIPQSELSKITEKTKIVSVTAVSNVLGTIVDTAPIIERTHAVGAVAVLDISQAVAHMPTDLSASGADFAIFSGHKMYGALGCGVLWGKYELLDKMPPFIMGGDMIEYVREQETTFAPVPQKFEAGTQDVAAAVSLGRAIDYMEEIGWETIVEHERKLLSYAMEKLSSLPYITLYAPEISKQCSVISFNINGVHPHDVASILDAYGVCVRSGNHCAQPLMSHLGVDSTCRATISVYNDEKDVDRLVSAVEQTYKRFEKYLG